MIQGFSLPTSAPKGVEVSVANQGTAFKFHRMGRVEVGSTVEVRRSEAVVGVEEGAVVRVEKLQK